MKIRTRITLDADVLEQAKAFSRARGLPFHQGLNRLLRAGLQAESARRPKRAFRVEPKHMGFRRGLNYDRTGELLELDGQGHL